MDTLEHYYEYLEAARREIKDATIRHSNALATISASLLAAHKVKVGDKVVVPETPLAMTVTGLYPVFDGEFYRIRVSGTLEGQPFHLLMDEGDELEIRERADG